MKSRSFTAWAQTITIGLLPLLFTPSVAAATGQRTARFMAGVSWNDYTGGTKPDVNQRSYLGLAAEAESIGLSQKASGSLVSKLGFDLKSRKFIHLLIGAGYGFYLGYPARKMQVSGQEMTLTYDDLWTHRLGFYAGLGRRSLTPDPVLEVYEAVTETIEIGGNLTSFWNLSESHAIYVRPEVTYITGIGAFRITSYNFALGVGVDF